MHLSYFLSVFSTLQPHAPYQSYTVNTEMARVDEIVPHGRQ